MPDAPHTVRATMPEEQALEQRDVLVVMPFGGEDNIENRRGVLNFKRIEHVLGKCEVRNVDSHCQVTYSVHACKVCDATDINETILERIRNADVVIALFCSSSPTVVYEAAVRHLMRDGLILIVDTAQPQFLPFYLQGLGYCPWTHESGRPVLERIDRIANDDGIRDLDDFDAELPRDLRHAIDEHDSQLRSSLEKALEKIEVGSVKPRADFVRAVAGGMLGGIITDRMTTLYSPVSVVAVAFSREDELDDHRPPIVCEFNEAFARLYGFPDSRAAELQAPLTSEKLLLRLERDGLIENFAEFVREQAELNEKIVRNKGIGWASTTMKISADHPHGDFRDRELLPCVVARQTVGNVQARHTMYLLVNYIDVTDLSERVKGETEQRQDEPDHS